MFALPYALALGAIVAFAIYNSYSKKDKVASIFIELKLKQDSDCLTLILGLPLMPGLTKITSNIATVKGINCIAIASNVLVVQKYSDFEWKKMLPEIKKVIKNDFAVTFK